MSLAAGQILNNRYRIAKLLGSGSFGAVYRAWDVNLNEPRVVKEILDTSPEASAQFTQEAKLLFGLRHTNLLAVHDFFVIPGQGLYLVMDFIEGEDLQSMLNRAGGPLSEAQVLTWIGQICDALEYLHSQPQPILHRDVRPANIKITPQGKAVLVEYGITRLSDPPASVLAATHPVTPGYSPPEMYTAGAITPATDIYSLGATVYTLLSGQAPPDSMALISGQAVLAPLGLVNPQVSASVSAAVEKALYLNSDWRYQNVLEFKAALTLPSVPATVVLPSEPSLAPVDKTQVAPPPPPPPPPPQPKRPRRNLLLWLIGIGLLIAVLAAGGYWVYTTYIEEEEEPTPTEEALLSTATRTPTLVATSTPQPSPTSTPLPTETPTLTPTPTETLTPTPTPEIITDTKGV